MPELYSDEDMGVPDYDYDAWRAANPGVEMSPGQHYPDTYKLPNHPTFSDQSIYSEPNAQGGQWGKNDNGSWNFTPGAANLQHFTPKQLQDYFGRVEPGNNLILPPGYDDGGPVPQASPPMRPELYSDAEMGLEPLPLPGASPGLSSGGRIARKQRVAAIVARYG